MSFVEDKIRLATLREQAEEMWQEFFAIVDSLCACGNYTTMNERQAACVEKEWDVWNLSRQINCPHNNTVTLGDADEEVTKCTECNKRL